MICMCNIRVVSMIHQSDSATRHLGNVVMVIQVSV